MKTGNTTGDEDPQLAAANRLAYIYMQAQPPGQPYHHKAGGKAMLGFVTDFTMPWDMKVKLVEDHVSFGVRSLRTLRAFFQEAEQAYRKAYFTEVGHREDAGQPEAITRAMAVLRQRTAQRQAEVQDGGGANPPSRGFRPAIVRGGQE